MNQDHHAAIKAVPAASAAVVGCGILPAAIPAWTSNDSTSGNENISSNNFANITKNINLQGINFQTLSHAGPGAFGAEVVAASKSFGRIHAGVGGNH